MASNIWGTTIDLTLDSDEETGPLEAFLSRDTLSSKNPRVPLPGQGTSHFTPTSTPQKSKPTGTSVGAGRQNGIPPTKSPATPASKPASHGDSRAITPVYTNGHGLAPASGQRNGSYVPVTSSRRRDFVNGFSSEQPEKRRKLSAHQPDFSAPPRFKVRPSVDTNGKPHPELPSDDQMDGGANLTHGLAKTDFPPCAAPSEPVASKRTPVNKPLSAQVINEALKENMVGPSFQRAIDAPERRELHLGRLHDRVAKSDPQPATTATSSNSTPIKAPHRLQTLSPDDEEILLDVDADEFLPHIPFRTSRLKKPTPTTRTSYYPEVSILPHSANSMLNAPRTDAIRQPFSPPSASPKVDGDVVISIAVSESTAELVRQPQTPGGVQTPHANVQSAADSAIRKINPSALSEEEAHLLIFLKEVKTMSWKDITVEFSNHFPGRSYSKLQSTYSTILNKRDRSKDPPRLKLPLCFASEAEVDWLTVHEDTPRGRGRKPNSALADPGLPNHHSQHQKRPWKPAFREHVEDYSSGAESTARRERPRRSVPVKDYTWKNLYRHDDVDANAEDYWATAMMDMDIAQRGSEELQEELCTAPEKAIQVDNEPMQVNYEKEDALFALLAERQQPNASGAKLPYISSSQRTSMRNPTCDYEWDQLTSRDWQGSVIHVDFSPGELHSVVRSISKVLNIKASTVENLRKDFWKCLQGLSEPKILRLVSEIRRHLQFRSRKSIEAFLDDARIGAIQTRSPRIERLAAARPYRDYRSEQYATVSSTTRQRELGLQSRRGWKAASRPLSYQLRNNMQDTLGPVLSYKGASSDVHAVAWSMDGQCFAAGAICVSDPDSMQYNRPNNLLYGNVVYKTIHELGEHCEQRPKTESGANSTHAMYASQDPRLFKTISSVAFSPNGRFLFSGGHDRCVALWEARSDGYQPQFVSVFTHKAEVDMMAVNRDGLLATASKKTNKNAIKTIMIPEDDPSNLTIENFSSQKASLRPDQKILPTALQFEPRDGGLLLAGFGANVRDDGRDTNGDIALWDVRTHQQLHVAGSGKNVFDVAFHPGHRWFAVGCVAGASVNRGTKSIIRLYDDHGDNERFSLRMELECKALDMNDVVWCPGDDYLIAAGCTSGRTYVWDVRWPDDILRELSHGRSLMPLDDDKSPEITDTGVRFLSWGDNATRLYSGSSDGIVKVWNVARSEEETFVKDLFTANSGIMSGKFSPDASRLVLGEVDGSINVLEVGRDDWSLKDAEPLKYFAYVGEDLQQPDQDSQPEDTDSGIAYSADLVQSGEMMYVPMGGFPVRQAVQGPNYDGPFDKSIDAPVLREQALNFQNSLSRNSLQCNIPLCSEGIVKVTSEETGDSGRSSDRIPDELRKQWKTIALGMRAVAGKARCTKCGRVARPSGTSSEEQLCERCSFACFRCGAVNEIPPATETVTCQTCKRQWDIGALGYECIRERAFREEDFYRMLRDEPSLEIGELLPDDEICFGDEMNALSDYYFSLAIDQPASPPL